MCVNIFNIFLHVMTFVINGIKYCLTEIFHAQALVLFIINLESCRVIILYLMLFIILRYY
jgi:hypothetical protein